MTAVVFAAFAAGVSIFVYWLDKQVPSLPGGAPVISFFT